MAIPFNVLGGYLGAGKTTLMNHLLKTAGGERLALIINDFGAINIDAALISEQTEDQINLTNGCICCGMSAGFDDALESLLERSPRPDRIIVEASGVADVTALAQYGHHPGLRLDGIIVLADVETVRAKARDKYVDRTVLRQLRGADLLVLNKIDLVSPDATEAVRAWFQEVAPGVAGVNSRHGEVPREVLFGLEPGGLRTDAALVGHAGHAGHETYASWYFTCDGPLPRAAVEAFIASLPDAVLRAKGFFLIEPGERYLFQMVGRRQSLTRADIRAPDNPGQTEKPATALVAIGLAAQLDAAQLDGIAEALQA